MEWTHEHFAPVSPEEKASLRRTLGLPDGPMVVWTGRISPEKRVDLLISAWMALQNEITRDASLVIVGDGIQESEIRLQAASLKNVYFTGAVDNVAAYLKAGDIFALPSDAEGLSVSMLEAMSCEMAVAATDVGAAREVVEDGITALLVPAGNIEAMKQALITLIQDQAVRRQMGISARQVVEKRFRLPVVCRQVMDVYQKISRRKPVKSMPD